MSQTMREANTETNHVSSNTGAFGIIRSARHAAGMFVFGLMTTILEVYLRLLDHFHALKQLTLVDFNCNTENLPDDHQQLRRMWLTAILKQFCIFGQRCLTFRALLSISELILLWFDLDNTSWTIYGISFGLMLVPRIVLSALLVAGERDILRHSQPKNPNRRVNVSIRLVSLVYNGIRKTFKVLNSVERLLVLLCQYSQYVFLQLLGYNYNNHRIALYSELEAFVSIIGASFIDYYTGVLPVGGFILLTLYFLRILLPQA